MNSLAIAIYSHILPLQTTRRSKSRLMYICICNAIREKDLREAALKSCGDAEATYAQLGKSPNCGQCLVKADEILAAERAQLSCEEVAV